MNVTQEHSDVAERWREIKTSLINTAEGILVQTQITEEEINGTTENAKRPRHQKKGQNTTTGVSTK